jgi:peptidoglycan/LPS O-acetylase OafA/YrhL
VIGAVRITYAPGLDGIRGICLLTVMLFHAPFSWASGGFLGVSTFFTLSGFLITALLLRESHDTGRVDFGAFWERRLRRLAPALWIGVGITLITSSWWISTAGRERLGFDAISSILFFSNWRFMAPEYAYTGLFVDPSAFQHYWSLAIEAQYYLLFPLLLGLLIKFSGRVGLVGLLAILFCLALVAGWADPGDEQAINRVYYGTDARSVEILAGAILAAVLARRPQITAHYGGLLGGLGGLALTGMAITWALSEVTSPWLYRGGFGAYSVLSVALVASALVSGGWMARVLSISPLRWVGKLSYGAYVYHWPIFLVVDEASTGLAPFSLFLLRLGLTLIAAQLSFTLVEEPIRRRKWFSSRGSVAAVGVTAISCLIIGSLAVSPDLLERSKTKLSIEKTRSFADDAPSLAIFGDSTGLTLGLSVSPWLVSHLGVEMKPGGAYLGCSLVSRGKTRRRRSWLLDPEHCRGLQERWSDKVEEYRPDIAVVLIGAWDVRRRLLEEGGSAVIPGDPEFDSIFRAEVERSVDMFASHGVRVIWLAAPPLRFTPNEKYPAGSKAAQLMMREYEPARMHRLNQIVFEVAQSRQEEMRIIDLASYISSVDSEELRSDGVHYAPNSGALIGEWIAPRIRHATIELLGRTWEVSGTE